MEGFPSGQREQTVNLSSMTSVVRIHHLPPKEPILIRVSVLFWCQVEWIRKPALRNVPVARFNRRGFAAAKRIHHRTGRQACSSATMGGNSQSWQARAQSEEKNRLFDSEINLHRLFGTIYCHLRRYLVGAHSVRPGSAKSYGLWANNVRPYGSAGADEFTNGVPRSYPRAPSFVHFPRISIT